MREGTRDSRTSHALRRATVSEVARDAGVSKATAARALGGYGSVSKGVRERVLLAARDLGYMRNGLAWSMSTGTTRTIGVVIADIENPYFARAVRGITDVARRAGFEVLLSNSDEDLTNERTGLRLMLEKRVDGMIIAPTVATDHAHLADLIARGVPVAFLDRTVPGLATDAVVVDNLAAARGAVEHLIALGHRRIGIIADATSQRLESALVVDVITDDRTNEIGTQITTGARLAGYLGALEQAGIPRDDRLIRLAKPTVASASRQALALLEGGGRPTAVFASDGIMTMGVFAAAKSMKLAIPGDLSVVGFDDLEWTRLVDPPLTVVAQPVYELGAAAARQLIRRIAGDGSPAPTTEVLSTTFIQRASTAPPLGAALADRPSRRVFERTRRPR